MHHKQIHPRIPSITLLFKYIFKFSNSMTNTIWSQIYSIHSNSSIVRIFKIIDYIKSKANQIYLKQVKIIQDVMSVHYQKI